MTTIYPFPHPEGQFGLHNEFDAWLPDPTYATSDQLGMISWTGSKLQPIPASAALPQVNLPPLLVELMQHCWKRASPTNPGTRTGPLASAHRIAKPGMTPYQVGQMAQRGRYVPIVSPTSPPPAPGVDLSHLKGVAEDWQAHNALTRINAYTFRGDSRGPHAIKAAGGFSPPVTRTDRTYIEGAVYEQFSGYLKRRYGRDLSKNDFLAAYDQTMSARTPAERSTMLHFTIWRALVDREASHVGRMLANEALKGYISTTSAVLVAKGFAKSNGWVYLTLVRGGFEIPDKGAHQWTAIFGEQEVAFPGTLDWTDVIGFRKLKSDQAKFDPASPIYLRKQFDTNEPVAFGEAYALLSGKPQ